MSDDSLELVRKALKKCSPDSDVAAITTETHLVGEGYVDSLDAMIFIFELEKLAGRKFAGFGEEFDDFQVANIISAMAE